MDSRLYPAVVKLLKTVVQSLTQMRSLSIVDESPDLASAVEARVTFIRARRYVAYITRRILVLSNMQVLLSSAVLYYGKKLRRSTDVAATCGTSSARDQVYSIHNH